MEVTITKGSTGDLPGGEKEDSQPVILGLSKYSAEFGQELGGMGGRPERQECVLNSSREHSACLSSWQRREKDSS